MKLLIKAYSHSIEDTHVQVGQVWLAQTTLEILPTLIFCLIFVIVLKTVQTNYPCGSQLFWSAWSRLIKSCSITFRSMRNSSRTWRTLALRTSFRSLQSRRQQGRRDPVSHRYIKHLSVTSIISDKLSGFSDIDKGWPKMKMDFQVDSAVCFRTRLSLCLKTCPRRNQKCLI